MKKIISVLMCVILTACIFFPLTAHGYSQSCPFIYIHGFMGKDLYSDKNDKDSEPVWPPSTDKILDLVKAHIGDLLLFLVTKDYDRLGDAILDPVNDLLSSANLSKDGEVTDSSGAYMVYPPADSIKADSCLDFNYDWRVDPIQSAQELNDFINYVTENSGCDKVAIECHSFGGIIVNTYTKLYGSDKLRSICYNTTAIYGETYTGEMMSGEIVFEGEAIVEFFKKMLGGNEYEKLLTGLIDILAGAGIDNDLAELANNIVEHLGERAIRDILMPMFGGWLSIWAMVPDKYVDSAKDFVFGKVYKDDGIDRSKLIEKIDRYNTEIRPYKTETLEKQNKEISIYVFSRYGFPSVPLTPSWKKMSDAVVDTESSSFGATCAEFGSTVDEKLDASADNSYLNPDNTIYAGTCMFKDQTWFFRNMPHADMCGDMDEIVKALLYSDGQATVKTFKEYPQYMVYDKSDKSISIDNGTPEIKESFFDKIFAFNIKILEFFRNIYDKIFSVFK